VNWEPQSDTIFFGTSCRHTIRVMHSFANEAPEYVVLMGIKWVTMVNQSTMTQIESYLAWIRSNPTIKSIPISSHFHSRIFSGSSNHAVLWCSAFTLWQVSQRDMCSAISLFIPYHQYQVFKSLYILVLPGLIKYVESWASQSINSLMCF
jgi:hypothetical protein